VQYTYTATGRKVRKQTSHQNAAENQKTDYSGIFLYQDNQLITIFTPAGRLVPDNALWQYEYNLTDHLGNVRAVFAIDPNGEAELKQTTDYYPFGMVMNQSPHTGSSPQNKFLYNGKELQDDVIAGQKLDWYDYGARMYDAAAGRFHSVDPLAYRFFGQSPYSYGANDPQKNIDIFGLAPYNIVTSDGKLTRAFMHLMNISTGISLETLLATKIKYRDWVSTLTGFSSGGITIYNTIFFTKDYDGDNHPRDIEDWFDILPHELQHRVQADNRMGKGYVIRYGIQAVKSMIKEGSIDREVFYPKMPMELEADYIQEKFNKFWKFANYIDINGSKRNRLTDLFSYGLKSQDRMIAEIDKLWDEFRVHQKEEEKRRADGAQQLLRSAFMGNLEVGNYTWNGNAWVRQ